MKKFTDAEEALNYVMNRKNAYIGYEAYAKVIETAGNPQNAFKTIHVAGTNGKGSTCFCLAMLLQSQGLKVGLFTSPHLINHRDRIRINGEWIDEDTFVRLLNNRLDLIEANSFGMFQIDFLLACDWYKEQKVDIAVMETGIGGLYDSTNVIEKPELEIITTIGFDHMAILGNTLEEIAAQKAGIIKPNSNVLIGNLEPCAKSVVRAKAEQECAELYDTAVFERKDRTHFVYDNDTYEVTTLGEYQKQNLATSLKAFKILGYDIHTPVVHAVIHDFGWPGRFEVMGEHPLVVVDGAHNLEGMSALVKSIDALPHPIAAVFTALKDKQGVEMAELLSEHVDYLYVTEISIARADKADHLANHGGTVISDWREAITQAEKQVGIHGSVVICGSLYLISDVRKWLVLEAE